MQTCLRRRQTILRIIIVFFTFLPQRKIYYVRLREYLFLFHKYVCCCEDFLPVVRIFCLSREFLAWSKNFLPVVRIILLSQEFFFLSKAKVFGKPY